MYDAQLHFTSMEQEAGETADQRAVEADVLKVHSDIDLNHVDQLTRFPPFHLIGDGGPKPRSCVPQRVCSPPSRSLD
jgi:hypothetical protein